MRTARAKGAVAPAIRYESSVPTERGLGSIIGGTVANNRTAIAAPIPLISSRTVTTGRASVSQTRPPTTAMIIMPTKLLKDKCSA